MATIGNLAFTATDRHPLHPLFAPETIAVIGATERPGSVGLSVLRNLSSFAGTVYQVNPNHKTVLGTQCFRSVADLPEPVDLAIIITPAPTVPGLIRECASAGIPGAIIISAGFKECGPAGAALEAEIRTEARRAGIRLLGPNCLGIMRPHDDFNATFAAQCAKPGNVAFISQSGALCSAILDWSLRENVGFSAFVSVGSMLDIGWGDLIYYLGDDSHTHAIVIYMESVGNARAFLSAAREVALSKPIIVIKVGRTEAAAQAAASHTGSLTGSDEVLHAAFRRVGVLRVDTIAELFDMAEVLAKQPRPAGPRLAIVTNAGGPGALATDMLVSDGGVLSELSPETRDALDHLLPPHWSHGNPVDILGDADPERYAKAVELVAKDPNTDGVLTILTPQAMTDATRTAKLLSAFAHLDGKPILASWMGGPATDAGDTILNEANIPTFKHPDRAARAFYLMWRYTFNLRALYETPALPDDPARTERSVKAEKIISTARKGNRTLLTELESKQILSAYGIPTVETRIATTEEQAVEHAERLGFPIVVKLLSKTITHKTDVGGVQLNLRTANGVRRAWRDIEQAVEEKAGKGHFQGVTVQPMIESKGYELILGSSVDPQFGPVLLFGAGGQLVEVFKDHALGLPPLNRTLARRLIEQTRVYTALCGVRGRAPVNLAALEELLVHFSHLVAEQRRIKEIDINPLLVSADTMIALDARMVLHDRQLDEEEYPSLAIRPYPTQYITHWRLKNGPAVTIRPIRPEDEPLMVKFHNTLSEQTVYHRYFSHLKLSERITHERLIRICFNDYDREIALVAEHNNPRNDTREILGVGRLSKINGFNRAEFAITIADQWQHHGLGTEFLKMLIKIGRAERLTRLSATILPENSAMQHLCRKAGFALNYSTGDAECRAEILL